MFPPPPAKRPYRRPVTATSTSNARETKTKPKPSGSSVSRSENARGMATGRSGDFASQHTAVSELVSGSQEKSAHRLGSEENVGQQSALSACDCAMQTLWSGQLAVNGTEICSAELVSRCHVKHAL